MSSEFDGSVLSRQLEGGRAGARVTLGFDGVSAVTRDGTRFDVPHRECVLSLGGASGRMWFFKARSGDPTILCEDPKLGQELRSEPPRLLQEELARVLAVHHVERKASARNWLVGLAIAGLVLLGLVYGLRSLGRSAVHALPMAVDRKLGELAAASMDMGGTVSDDPVLRDALRAIEQRLAPHVKPSCKFTLRVVQSDMVNAFALPGGIIIVHTGLLREAGSVEEVAGALAHEMSHVTRRHGMERIAQSIGLVSAIQLLFGDVSGVLAIGVEILQVGAINSYSRDQEHEADMDGVDTLLAANVDPEGLAQLFQRLLATQGDLPEELTWLGTHPDLKGRAADVRARAKAAKHGAYQPIAVDFANVKRHAGAVLDATPIVP